MIQEIEGRKPKIHPESFTAPGAQIIGDVELKKDAGVWHNAVIRGDMARITIGRASNVQDNCTLHCDLNKPLTIGENVTVGHNAILHSCTVGDGSIVGMGAIVLNDAVIGKSCMIAAGAVVTPRTVIPDGSMVMGSPAKIKRELTQEEKENMLENAAEYVRLSKQYAANQK